MITQAAVAAVTDRVRQDWQKRGLGGLVESVDAAAGTVTLSIPSLTAKKTVVVRTTKDTVVHRYAPDSAKPEDSKPSSLAEIHPGDQLRARGNKTPEGTEISAEEIYAGVFPQYAATVKSVDAISGMLNVQDLASKKTVQVKISADSQLHKIPAEMAQRFAMCLKGTMPAGAPASANGSRAGAGPASAGNAQASSPTGTTWSGGGNGGGMRSGCPTDIPRSVKPNAVYYFGGHESAKRRRREHPGDRGDAEQSAYGDHTFERGGADPASCAQREFGDDADTLEPGRRRSRRRCIAIARSSIL